MAVTPAFLSPDDSLSLNSLTTAVSTVKQFWDVLMYLGVPDSVRKNIRRSGSYSSEEDKREAGLQYYLQTLPDVTWGRIAGGLWRLGACTALETVKQYLPHTHGQYQSVCVYFMCPHLFVCLFKMTIIHKST